MNLPLNISSTSIIIPACFVSAGIASFTGILALLMRFAGRQTAAYPAFAAMCFCVAGFQFAAAEYYMTDTIAQASVALRWQVAALIVFIPAFFIFVARYTRQEHVNSWLVALTLLCGGLLVFNFASPFSLRFSSLQPISPLIMPWGEKLSRFSGTAGIGNWLYRIANLGVVFWALWRSSVQSKCHATTM